MTEATLPQQRGLTEVLRAGGRRWGGRSTTVAARLDPRCSYCLFVPNEAVAEDFRNLLIYVHGEGRSFQYILNALAPLAKACNYVLVCPLFPANLLRDGNIAGYKYLREGDIRYDLVLLDIVDEVRQAFAFREPRFVLGGFSGGGQFCHRFAYFHPDQVSALSVAAPGSVTLLDRSRSLWAGIADGETIMGRRVDVEGLRAIRLQLVVGELDGAGDDPLPQAVPETLPATGNVAGANRVERLRSLWGSWQDNGIPAELCVVPGARHDFRMLVPSISEFFEAGVNSRPPAPLDTMGSRGLPATQK